MRVAAQEESSCRPLRPSFARPIATRGNRDGGLMEIATAGVPIASAPVAATLYCNNFVTACCVLLACASALMPVWVRI